MITCKKCGAENPDEFLYCQQCGNKLEPSVDMSSVKDTVTDVAGKAFSGAKDLADQINKKVNTTLEDQKKKAKEAAQKEIKEAQENSDMKKNAGGFFSGYREEYMSSTELWSWLQKDSKRQHFYTEEENTITQEDYMNRLAEKLAANNVPAAVVSKNIQWDRSSVEQRSCFVYPQSSAVNPLSCLIQFNHVGKFTFVEEKTFITPPDLPEIQRKVKIDPDLAKRAGWVLWGCIIAVVGLFWLLQTSRYDSKMLPILLLLIGGGMAFLGLTAQEKLKELKRHNAACAKQEKAWTQAWDNWENSIFLHSFQESTNGQISRIYDAAFECIKQLNEELFAKQASEEQQESQSMNELEQMIARRRDDYR